MGGQFTPDCGWSVCSGKWVKKGPFKGGQFAPESGGQFDRILHLIATATNRALFGRGFETLTSETRLTWNLVIHWRAGKSGGNYFFPT